MHHRDGLDCFQYRLFEPIIIKGMFHNHLDAITLHLYRTIKVFKAHSHRARLHPYTRRRALTRVYVCIRPYTSVLIIQWQATLWHVTCSWMTLTLQKSVSDGWKTSYGLQSLSAKQFPYRIRNTYYYQYSRYIKKQFKTVKSPVTLQLTLV